MKFLSVSLKLFQYEYFNLETYKLYVPILTYCSSPKRIKYQSIMLMPNSKDGQLICIANQGQIAKSPPGV
jgi:hypothetical protein